MIEKINKLCNNTEVFYKTSHTVDDVNVDLYSYRLAEYKDFKDNDAFEIRGLTVLNNKVIPSLRKFFNLNENEDWLIEDIKEPIQVQEKKDGSLIQFIKINNKFIAKSMMSFISDQAKQAQKLLTPDLEMFLNYCDSNNLYPLFELTAPDNQIVLFYPRAELTLLQIRHGFDFLELETVLELADQFNINVTKTYTYSLKELLDLQQTQENIEGYVCQDSNGKFFKVKTLWYLELHRKVSDIRDDVIFKATLDGEVDDLLSLLTEGSDKKNHVKEIQHKTDMYFNHLVQEYKELRRKYFQDFEEDKKKFAIKYEKERLFPYVIRGLKTSFTEIEETARVQVKAYIDWNIKTLTQVRNVLGEYNEK